MNDELRAKFRGEHIINIRLSYEFKERLQKLAEKYDRTVADMVRALLKIGIPVMEGISEADEMMVKEYVALIRRFRKIKNLKEL
jgi:predicted DNA-binding protein